MTDTDTPQFTLTAPDGSIIAHGSLDALMERLPDTQARGAAMEAMLHTAAEAEAAEQRLAEAQASAAQMLADGVTRLASRLDAIEEQRALAAQQAEAEQLRRDEQQVQDYLDALPDPDALADEGDLTLQQPIQTERYGAEDEAPVKPALSYPRVPTKLGNVPMSFVKTGDNDPLPFNPQGGRDTPGPAPGSRLSVGPPQHAQPVAISLHEEEE